MENGVACPPQWLQMVLGFAWDGDADDGQKLRDLGRQAAKQQTPASKSASSFVMPQDMAYDGANGGQPHRDLAKVVPHHHHQRRQLSALVRSPLTEFIAVITATRNAETLPYGPAGGIAAAMSSGGAYFCTDCIDTPVDSWTQTVACDGVNVDMTLVYNFDSAMSVVDRMRQCAATGCNVGFTVSGTGITTATSFNSDWWFTDATVLPSTSGPGVSSDDGMWGGAPGEVNGDGQCYGNAGTTRFYGFGNCNSDDYQGVTVYYGPGGYKQCPSLKAQLYATAS